MVDWAANAVVGRGVQTQEEAHVLDFSLTAAQSSVRALPVWPFAVDGED